MEMWRLMSEGRVSEVIGAEGLPHDRLVRMLKFRGPWDETEFASYHPEGRRIFEAFAAGINAFIEHRRENLPVEFKVTGIEPEPWTAEAFLSGTLGLLVGERNVGGPDYTPDGGLTTRPAD
jgi:penicillin amidase